MKTYTTQSLDDVKQRVNNAATYSKTKVEEIADQSRSVIGQVAHANGQKVQVSKSLTFCQI